jgi:hypothetical protein
MFHFCGIILSIRLIRYSNIGETDGQGRWERLDVYDLEGEPSWVEEGVEWEDAWYPEDMSDQDSSSTSDEEDDLGSEFAPNSSSE